MKKFTYVEMEEEIRKIDKTLKAIEFPNSVYIAIDEGSVFFFRNAFCHIFDKEWFVIFTEHHGFHIYHESDIKFCQNLRDINMKKTTISKFTEERSIKKVT